MCNRNPSTSTLSVPSAAASSLSSELLPCSDSVRLELPPELPPPSTKPAAAVPPPSSSAARAAVRACLSAARSRAGEEAQRRALRSSVRTTISPIKVLPVPGGPCTSPSRRESSALAAAICRSSSDVPCGTPPPSAASHPPHTSTSCRRPCGNSLKIGRTSYWRPAGERYEGGASHASYRSSASSSGSRKPPAGSPSPLSPPPSRWRSSAARTGRYAPQYAPASTIE
mmetsp:Transcript_283/g.873  ORF Transcript_283/g.873 Transcript_283/m.873 type:complete len:227 (+) Transcript_283:336-1016(+)